MGFSVLDSVDFIDKKALSVSRKNKLFRTFSGTYFGSNLVLSQQRDRIYSV